MKQLLSILNSMKTMVTLMIIFAFSIGYATFVENDFGTVTAKAEIYNALWFEILLGLLAFNLTLNIIKYKMYTLEKAPIFLFHLSFLVILVGAAITRFVGFEGSMHIREGATASSMTSSDTFWSVNAQTQETKASHSEAVFLSKRSQNSLETTLSLGTKDVTVKLLEYTPDAIEEIVADESGKGVAEMMVSAGGQGVPLTLNEGNFYDAGSFVIDFNSSQSFTKPVISLYLENDLLFMKHPMKLSFFKMDDRSKGDINASEEELFHTRVLYTLDEGNFVLRSYMPHASKKIITDPNAKSNANGLEAFKFLVSVDGKSSESYVFGRKGVIGKETNIILDGVAIGIAYGAKELKLPFGIKLLDFQLERYPGSMSPSSYASEVELIDIEQGVHVPYRIFMNNILEHRGYRFFQASYDEDEGGTILSVNYDPGTLPSYIGYTLLGIGMFWSLFSRRHRFSKLAKKAKDASEAKAAGLLLAIALAFGATPSNAAEQNAALDPAIATILAFDKAHAQKFGELVVQDSRGRMKPMDTLSTEVLAKVHSSNSFGVGKVNLTPNQVILGMMIRPDVYKEIKIIKTKDEKVNQAISARIDAKYASFSQFFEDPVGMRGYKLAELVENASRKEPKYRDKLDKAVLKVDEQVNVVYMVFTGSLLSIWPKAGDANNKWFATIEALQTFPHEEADALREIALGYFSEVDASLSSGEWSKSDAALQKIAAYQKLHGAGVYPSDTRIKAETFYNYANIFERLFPYYLLVGFILLVLSFTNIIKPAFKMRLFTKAALYILIGFFIIHTFGLALRWYISGHAPWSDGYESMIYIAWATVLAGFIFSKRSPITLAATSILTGLILFVAHLNWMNPQVTNLVPVLNSYWLSIHVSMITASYGFLGLGALLGFIVLLLFVIKSQKNEKQISLSIKELNAISEMSLMVGLVLLTFGNFLGGVWANESWGRYWGWDPKETWALVTILVYAVVIHLRFIKSLYSEFNFAVISLLSFTSVLMTYFGVNYYLAGMHSYAKGDPVPIPDFVPVTYAIIFVIVALAFRNRKIA